MPLDTRSYIEQLGQLIALPSVSSTQASLDMSNRGVIDLLANWLADLGFTIDIQAVDEAPGKANLIATLGEGDQGLVFAGHTDTVPYDDNRWQHDPFNLTIENDRAFGLGATDMKGFFPVVLAAIQPFLHKPLKQPIIILATADEESSMSGARALVNSKTPKARYAVIGEPTAMSPIRMHKGITMEAIRVTGQSGHSSNPALGVNAIDVMHEVIGSLKSFRQELAAKYQHSGFTIEVPTLNLGCIHGGDNPNRICGQCELEFDLRPLPGMSLDSLRNAIDQHLSLIEQRYQVQLERRVLFPGVEPFEQAVNSPLIETVEKLTGQQSESVAFATEAPFLKALGMDVVVMGPGSINQAHQPDEFIPLDELDGAVNVLQGLIKHFCV